MNELQMKESLATLRFHSTASLALVLAAVSVFAFTLYYSTSRLTPLENERAILISKLQTTKTELQEAQTNLQQAHRELSKIQEKTKNARSSFLIVQKGLHQFFVKDYTNAISYYDKAIAQDPSNPIPFDLRGFALLRGGRVEEAIVSLEKSVSLDQNYVWGHYNLAKAYGTLNANDPRALEHIKMVLKLDPSMRDTIRNDGQFRIFKLNREYHKLISEG